MAHPSLITLFVTAVTVLPGTWVAAMTDPCPATASATGPAPDHSVFTSVLQAVVGTGSVNGVTSSLVDYKKLRADPAQLQKYMLSLCSVDIAALSAEAQLALYANAYNALMLSIIVHYDPPATVREIHDRVSSGSIWKEPLGTVGGEKVSLDIIEHTKIRGSGLAHSVGVAGRIHSAMVCASLSCPDIQTEAFEASTVVSQVTAATKRWLMNPTKNPGFTASESESGSVKLSMIFKWYGGDFVQESGSIVAFLRKYTTWSESMLPDNAEIGFIDYNWNLNAGNSVCALTGKCYVSGARTLGGGIMIPVLTALCFALVAFHSSSLD